MKTSVMEVHDMLSVLSVEGVEKRIGEVPGVESVTVNHAAGSATVRYDETRLDVADIRSDVRQSGYEADAAGAEAQGNGHAGHMTHDAHPPAPAPPQPAPPQPAPPQPKPAAAAGAATPAASDATSTPTSAAPAAIPDAKASAAPAPAATPATTPAVSGGGDEAPGKPTPG